MPSSDTTPLPSTEPSTEGPPTAGAEPAERRTLTAARHLPSHLRIWPVAFGGLAVDLWSKHWAFTHGNVPDESRVVVDKLLSFQLSLNSGALFGLGRGMAPLFVAASVLALLFVWYLFTQSTRDRRSLHVALGLILGGALGNLYDRSFHEADAVFGPPAPGFWHGLLGDHVYATGVLLNAPEDPIWQLGRFPDGIGDVREVPNREELYLKSVPVVRDFIKIDATILGKPVWQWIFNIADVLLVIGVGLLLLNFWWERRAYNASTEATADSRHNP